MTTTYFYDYYADENQREAEAEAHFAEQERLDLQNSSGVDMPNLVSVTSWFTWKYQFEDHCEANGCLTLIEEVPF